MAPKLSKEAAATVAAALERKRQSCALGYTAARNLRLAGEDAARAANTKRMAATRGSKRKRAEESEDEAEVDDEDEAFQQHGQFILAVNPITVRPSLMRARVRALKPSAKLSTEERKAAETLFWSTNTVVVSSLEELAGVEDMFKPLIKRLYIAHVPDMSATYRKTTITSVVGKLKAGLDELKSLEWLDVAFVYPDAEARRQEAVNAGVKSAHELRIVVAAVNQLELPELKEKVVVMMSEGEQAGVDTVETSEESTGDAMVSELLSFEVGVGLAV